MANKELHDQLSFSLWRLMSSPEFLSFNLSDELMQAHAGLLTCLKILSNEWYEAVKRERVKV